MSTDSDLKTLIIGLTDRLLKCISAGDYTTYVKLVDPSLTAFEPEAVGNLVAGLDFHKFYFDNSGSGRKPSAIRTSIISPVVHKLGPESACIAYIRLTQYIDNNGNALSKRSEETRVWRKNGTNWQMIHFHRSDVPGQV